MKRKLSTVLDDFIRILGSSNENENGGALLNYGNSKFRMAHNKNQHGLVFVRLKAFQMHLSQ